MCKLGYKHTSETLEKMKKVHTGFKHSDEAKLKVSIARKGKPLSEEHKEKLRLAKLGVKGIGMTGKNHTIESKLSMSKNMKGRIPWNKDTAYPEWLRKKCGEKNIGRTCWCSGKKLSEEHKLNISIGTIKGMNNEVVRNKLIIHRAKLVLPIKDTSIEIKVQNFLTQLGIEYFTHRYIKEIEHGYQCDIFIPSMNLVIECDGDYWHKYPTGTDIDRIRTTELIQNGFKVLRLWEHEINQMNINILQERLNGI